MCIVDSLPVGKDIEDPAQQCCKDHCDTPEDHKIEIPGRDNMIDHMFQDIRQCKFKECRNQLQKHRKADG